MASETTTTAPVSVSRSATVRDVPADKFIDAYSRFLKRSGRVTVPKWAELVKTGFAKELAPTNPDWFYIRVASVARKLYLSAGIGVEEFRRIYGAKKNRGSKPGHRTLGSGAVVRAALKQLEKLAVIEKDPKGGRRITVTGQRDLDRISGHVINNKVRRN